MCIILGVVLDVKDRLGRKNETSLPHEELSGLLVSKEFIPLVITSISHAYSSSGREGRKGEVLLVGEVRMTIGSKSLWAPERAILDKCLLQSI